MTISGVAMMDCLWTYRARLRRVIDADTMELVIDTGFHSQHIERVRVADIDAPEARTDEGRAAALWAYEWFDRAEAATVSEWTLLVRTIQVGTRHGLAQDMTYNRYVAHIWDTTGVSYGQALVEAGHAVRLP